MQCVLSVAFNPLNAELNPICHLLSLLGAHHILHIGRIRVNGPKTSLVNLIRSLCIAVGLQWHSWLRHYAANQKVAGSVPFGVIGILLWLNPSSSTILLESIHPLNRNECQECFLGGV